MYNSQLVTLVKSANLICATQGGRAILFPIVGEAVAPFGHWRATAYIPTVLNDIGSDFQEPGSPFAILTLRCQSLGSTFVR
jgi:hypothetical protein